MLNSPLPEAFFLPILANPSFPAFPGSRVAAGKSECRNVGIGNLYSLSGILGEDAHKTGSERRAGYAVKNIAFDLGVVLECQGDIATIVKRFLECDTEFFFRGKLRHPALYAFVVCSGSNFKKIGVERRTFRVAGPVGVPRACHARVSSSWFLPDWICTSGL